MYSFSGQSHLCLLLENTFFCKSKHRLLCPHKLCKLRQTKLSQFVYFSLVLREQEEPKSKYSAPKRAKAEFLIHLDGIRTNKYQSNEPVLFLASTNLPWTLDPAIIRRYLLKNTNKTKVQLSMTFESFYDLYLLSFCLVQAIKYDEISNIRKNTLAFLIL